MCSCSVAVGVGERMLKPRVLRRGPWTQQGSRRVAAVFLERRGAGARCIFARERAAGTVCCDRGRAHSAHFPLMSCAASDVETLLWLLVGVA